MMQMALVAGSGGRTRSVAMAECPFIIVCQRCGNLWTMITACLTPTVTSWASGAGRPDDIRVGLEGILLITGRLRSGQNQY
jgi:hypothetical protein